MKKYLAIFVAAVMAVSVCGCSSEQAGSSHDTGSSQSVSEADTEVTATAEPEVTSAKGSDSSAPESQPSEIVPTDSGNSSVEDNFNGAVSENENNSSGGIKDEPQDTSANIIEPAPEDSSSSTENDLNDDSGISSEIMRGEWSMTKFDGVDFVEYAASGGVSGFSEYPVIIIGESMLKVEFMGQDIDYSFDMNGDVMNVYDLYDGSDGEKEYIVSVQYNPADDTLIMRGSEPDDEGEATLERGRIAYKPENPTKPTDPDEPVHNGTPAPKIMQDEWTVKELDGEDFLVIAGLDENDTSYYPVLTIEDDSMELEFLGEDDDLYFDVNDGRLDVYMMYDGYQDYQVTLEYHPESDTIEMYSYGDTEKTEGVATLVRGRIKHQTPENPENPVVFEGTDKELYDIIKGCWTMAELDGQRVEEYLQETDEQYVIYPYVYLGSRYAAFVFSDEYNTGDFTISDGRIVIDGCDVVYNPADDTLTVDDADYNGGSLILTRGITKVDGSVCTDYLFDDIIGDWKAVSVTGMTLDEFEDGTNMDIDDGLYFHFEEGNCYMLYEEREGNGRLIQVSEDTFCMIMDDDDEPIGELIYNRAEDTLTAIDYFTYNDNGELVGVVFKRVKN